MHNLSQLRRLRLAVFIVVLAGIGSSVAMNVFHAPDNPIARFVAALPPLAVFGCLELVVRIPSSSKALSVVRIFGAALVAIGAAVLSYAQQYAAITDLGFPHWQAVIWPGVIDGTMVVASLSLVEVVRKIRQMGNAVETPVKPVQAPTSPGMPPADLYDTAAALEYRDAVKRMQQESRLAALNG